MTKRIERFEELQAWQEARQLCRLIYGITSTTELRKDFGLRDQIQRAAVSVASNISEGFHDGSSAELLRFLAYARRSAAEVQTCLYIALDQRYIQEPQFKECYEQAERTAKLVNGLKRYLHESNC